MKTRSPLANPFYVALLFASAIFVVTCTSYAFWLGGIFDKGGRQDHPLVQFLEQRGERWMLIQVGIIAVLTAVAFLTDQRWRNNSKRQGAVPKSQTSSDNQGDSHA